jgi:hypothetical protein
VAHDGLYCYREDHAELVFIPNSFMLSLHRRTAQTRRPGAVAEAS